MKSECRKYQEQIAALLLGDLPEKEAGNLEAHLAVCLQCRSERDRYTQSIQQLSSLNEEMVPHHFFIHSEERSSRPWQLFLQMQRRSQAAVACVVAMILALGVAAISQLQIQSNSDGWAVRFGGNDSAASGLKKEILDLVEKNKEAGKEWAKEFLSEIDRSQTDRVQQVQVRFKAALETRDARIAGLMAGSEGQIREDMQKLLSALYQSIEQRHEQDLKAVYLRLEKIDATNTIKTLQTNAILDTLLQTTEIKLP
jgi:hypothetical protein